MMRKKSKKLPGASGFHHMYVENLFGKILVLHIASVDTYVFKYDGPLNLYLEGNKIVPRKFYLLKPGSIIKGPNTSGPSMSPKSSARFVRERNKVKIVLAGEDLTCRFKNGANGIHKFGFNEESGNLIGIMGGSEDCR